jgi:hypothetical protein
VDPFASVDSRGFDAAQIPSLSPIPVYFAFIFSS